MIRIYVRECQHLSLPVFGKLFISSEMAELDQDQLIAIRLRCAREELGVPRSKLAREIGIPPSRLESYEIGRAPLPADVAIHACEILHLNKHWLATGRGAPNAYRKIEDHVVIFEREKFSDFYERKLKIEEAEIQKYTDLYKAKIKDLIDDLHKSLTDLNNELSTHSDETGPNKEERFNELSLIQSDLLKLDSELGDFLQAKLKSFAINEKVARRVASTINKT